VEGGVEGCGQVSVCEELGGAVGYVEELCRDVALPQTGYCFFAEDAEEGGKDAAVKGW